MKFLFLFILIPFLAYGGIISRQHSDTIQSGKKIIADDLNDEFNVIHNEINGSLDTNNIADESLLIDDIAQTESAYVLNSKRGCDFDRATAGEISIRPPCEIYLDGKRGAITATESVIVAASLDTGSLSAATFYYVYGFINNDEIDFEISATVPLVRTTRKTGDTTRRFIGTIRTEDADTDVSLFSKNGNRYYFRGTRPTTGLQSALSTSAADTIFTLPNTTESVILEYATTVGGTDAVCLITPYDVFPAIQYRSGASAAGDDIYPFPVPVFDGILLNSSYTNTNNCSSVTITVFGYIEHQNLHQ